MLSYQVLQQSCRISHTVLPGPLATGKVFQHEFWNVWKNPYVWQCEDQQLLPPVPDSHILEKGPHGFVPWLYCPQIKIDSFLALLQANASMWSDAKLATRHDESLYYVDFSTLPSLKDL